VSLLEFAKALASTALSTRLQTIPWMVPVLQSVHIITVGVVFVSILMVSLRVLGRVRAEEPLPLVWRRFAPFLWTGVVIMATTGTLLVIAEPVREFMTLSFRLKMSLLAIGLVSAAVFGHTMRRAARAAGGESAPQPSLAAGVRFAAVATLLLWVAIIFLGRGIAYDNSVWGDWSPAILQRGGAA
jgi:hypothetical protein